MDNEAIQMVEVVGVRYKPVGKVYFFDPVNIPLKKGDGVIVEDAQGMKFGRVAMDRRQVSSDKVVRPLKPVIRKATEADANILEVNKRLAAEARIVGAQKIKEHKLAMKLLDVEYTFDNAKLIFYFSAEGRVDFRELLKALAGIFKTRIELKQIGIRDETKVVGGLSVCGRPYCCNTFLPEFELVSIKMAKDQNLSINSQKISGACGRLMCCLRYEHETYENERKLNPRINAIVKTKDGTGVVTDVNVLTGMLTVMPSDKPGENNPQSKKYHRSEVKVIGQREPTEEENTDRPNRGPNNFRNYNNHNNNNNNQNNGRGGAGEKKDG